MTVQDVNKSLDTKQMDDKTASSRYEFFHESVAKRHQSTQDQSFLSAVGCAQNIFSTSWIPICMIFVTYER